MEDLGKELAKGAGSLVNEVYKDSSQQTIRHLGTAFGAVMEWALQKTYTLRLGNERRKLEFERNMKMLGNSIESIPEQKVIEVAPEFSVPILEKLTYTSNEDLAKLFVNLLNKASNSDTIAQAHPAFVSIIESLSFDEARVLQHLTNLKYFAYLDLRVKIDDDGTFFTQNHYITFLDSLNLDFPQNTQSYLSHFIGLGLLQDMSPAIKAERTEILDLKLNNKHLKESMHKKLEEIGTDWKVYWVESYFQITEFGHAFIRACVPS